jgi:hypothetical protein
MPRDVTEDVLAKVHEGLPWTEIGLMATCKRADVESGKALKSLAEASNERSELAPQFSLLIARPL